MKNINVKRTVEIKNDVKEKDLIEVGLFEPETLGKYSVKTTITLTEDEVREFIEELKKIIEKDAIPKEKICTLKY